MARHGYTALKVCIPGQEQVIETVDFTAHCICYTLYKVNKQNNS